MVHVIIGPPCGGKSTYIRENSQPGDLIIDYDVIAQALGATESHRAEGLIKNAALAARTAAINEAIGDGLSESWVIHSVPSDSQLDFYRSAGAEIIVLDPGRDEVMARAKRDNRPSNTYVGIDRWYQRKAEIMNSEQRHRLTNSEETIRRRIISRQSDHLRNLATSGIIGTNSRNW